MPRSRRRVWLRDELILAFDLYVRQGVSAQRESIEELSAVLREFPIESELASNPAFRSRASVRRKLANFLALETGGAAGLSHGGGGDRDVWNTFATDRPRLSAAAEAIRAALSLPEAQDGSMEESDFSEAMEGRLLTRAHLARERSAKLVAAKKRQVLLREGLLACEACGFDFAMIYGQRGEGFIECHHLRPVASLRPDQITRLSDLALLCSNCHRMVHRKSPWLTMDQLTVLRNGR